MVEEAEGKSRLLDLCWLRRSTENKQMPEWVESILSSSVLSKLCKYTFYSRHKVEEEGGRPPPHAKPGKAWAEKRQRERGIKPHVMFSYVWIYGSKMCTLHTNVSSKTPSRSPQGSAQPVVGGGGPGMFGKNWISKPGPNFFVRYDCYRSNNEEQNWQQRSSFEAGFFPYSLSSKSFCHRSQTPFSFFFQFNASLAIVRNGWSCSSTHFCLFTIICPSIQPNKGFPSIQMVILPPETLSRFWNFESEIVPAIAIMTVAREQGEGGWG